MADEGASASASPPDDPRWLLIALHLMGIHQVQSVLVDRSEVRFRTTTLTVAALTPLTMRLPRRRGAIWMLLALPPLCGAFIGHLVPIMRDRSVPAASETAPLNLAGAAFLRALGLALVRPPANAPVRASSADSNQHRPRCGERFAERLSQFAYPRPLP